MGNSIITAIANGVVNAGLALAKGENAAAQAAGAMTGEAMGILSHSLYGKTPEELTETEKQNISAWATLASGIAGGLISDNSAGVANAAQAGKVVVENNYLSSKNVADMKKELEEADKTGEDKTGIYDKYSKISKENRDKAIAEIESGGSFDAIGTWVDLNGGVNVADSLKWIALFDDLSTEDRSQLVNFVKAENSESAQAIYDSLSVTAKVALYTKDAADNMGVGGAIPGSGVSVVGIKGGVNKGSNNGTQSSEGKPNSSQNTNRNNNSNQLNQTYTSIKDAPQYPQGFRAIQNGTTRNVINNKQALEDFRKIESGRWYKVYKDGYDVAGNKVSVHYFQSQSGRVINVKVKSGWSNMK
ncbi:VENN motif pre-toxin domain-containing protein [Proteus hauseri]|uniref:VENN motif pre-toxin domain-containing protein n=1 Tax=Proteus hauseri TaxID=183417 RepID=UPI0032DA3702